MGATDSTPPAPGPTPEAPTVGLARDTLIAVGLSLGAIVAIGLTRFAYALLLPAMRADLGWDFATAGGLNTANGLGYVVGALVAAHAARRFGPRQAFVGSIAASGALLAAMAATASYPALVTLRLLGGITTAITFIVGASLAAQIRPGASPRRSSWLLAVYMAGVSASLVLSGLLLPPILERFGAGGWRHGWLALGTFAIAASYPAARAAARIAAVASPASTLPRGVLLRLSRLILAYTLFGAGYVSYMTFVIALLRGQAAPNVVTLFWIVLGTTSLLFTLRWGGILSRLPDGRGFAAVSLALLGGTAPILLSGTVVAVFVSAVTFGATFMAGPTAITIFVRARLARERWTSALAILTAAFSCGQAIGPVLSGAIADFTGELRDGLWASPIVLLLAALIALTQPRDVEP